MYVLKVIIHGYFVEKFRIFRKYMLNIQACVAMTTGMIEKYNRNYIYCMTKKKKDHISGPDYCKKNIKDIFILSNVMFYSYITTCMNFDLLWPEKYIFKFTIKYTWTFLSSM